jgi:uncharacterized protein (TIGR03790 family)
MAKRLTRFIRVALLVVAGVAPARTALAQGPENVAVVINDTSPISQRVGEYYVRKRGIPPSNVIHIKTATTDEISRAAYAVTIEAPIAAAIGKASLQDRILYIVLTKDVPLRVTGTSGTAGTVASVDSELTLLYRKMAGSPVAVAGRVNNPYFLGTADLSTATPFTHEKQDIYLVTRLDGFTAEDAIALVDRAAAPDNTGMFVLDGKDTLFNRTGDDWLDAAGARLAKMGLPNKVLLDDNAAPVRDGQNVLGYFSWGSNDPMNRVRHFGMSFAPGAITGTFVSSDARTFKEPPADWQPLSNWNDQKTWFGGSPQSLVGDLIREGATGASGYVAEPYLESTERPQILFPAYASGFNLAESYYLGLPHLSWQSVVIGDPLCRPFVRKTLARSDIEAPRDEKTELPGYFSKRRLAAATPHLTTLDPETLAIVIKAEARLSRGDRPGAKKAYEEAVTADPKAAMAQLQLGMLEDLDGNHDAAIERYKKVIAVEPRNAAALNNLAYGLAVYKNDPATARPYADKAAALTPRDATVLDTLAWIQHLQGENAAAAKLIQQAVNGVPGNAEVRMHAAFIYATAAATAAALNEYQLAVKLDPSLAERPDMKELKRKLEDKQGGGKSLPEE